MRTPIAWANTFQNRKRTIAAVGGICFAVLLIFMQAGFLGAAKRNASIAYSMLDFDVIVISRGYLTMPRSETVDRFRIVQAANFPGVARISGLLVDAGEWKNPVTGEGESCFIFGVEPGDPVFIDPDLNAAARRLRASQSVLVDRNSRRDFGPWAVGGTCRVNGLDLQIGGDYTMGMGLLADGGVIASEDTYARLFGLPDISRYNFGLIKVRPGWNAAAVAAALRKTLPSDVAVSTKAEIMRREERYFVSVKPVGIMFEVGMAVAFVVGAVILYQILSTEITNRLREFATMKAIGYTNRFIYLVGIEQGLLFSVLSYLPSLILSTLMYRVLRKLSGFPIEMDAGRALFVFALSIAMCAIAGVLALGKIRRADPADLF